MITLVNDFEILAYTRENGKVGVRNHVAIIAIDSLAIPPAKAISNMVSNTVVIPCPYGRLQFGEDLNLTFKTLIGVGKNPNIAKALVIGIEPVWAKKVADGIAESEKEVKVLSLVKNGFFEVVRQGARIVRDMVIKASQLKREPHNLSELTISIKCGASDTTSGIASNPAVGYAVDYLVDIGATVLFGETTELAGAEHFIAKRFKDRRERKKFLNTFNEYIEFAKSQGVDIIGSQPTQENIAGGLSTIEEKALGNIQKTGKRQIEGVLKPCEEPKGKGLWFMSTSSSAQECVTLFSASGAQIHIFSTGQGNPVGNPIEPVIKVTGNPETAKAMSEHIDVDVSGIITSELSIGEAGKMVINELVKVANGKLTSAEVLRYEDFAITKLHRSM